MQQIQTRSEKPLSPIGIGTYGIGGRGHSDVALKDIKEDQIYIDAITNQLQTGYNFSEISLGYGHGNSAKLFAKALGQIGNLLPREDLFITNSVYPRDLPDFATVVNDINSMYTVFQTVYFDSTLVTQSLIVKFGYDQIITLLKDLLNSQRTRYVSLSNSNKTMIRKFKEEFTDSFFAHETHLSFEIRECQDEGIFDVCNELNVQSIIWRPLRQNLTTQHNWEPLVKLEKKYGKTQNQIILNWMKSLGFKPEVFSTSRKHILENWEAMQFTMEQAEYDELTNWRVPGYNPPKINWENMGNGDSIVPVVRGFEENYGK